MYVVELAASFGAKKHSLFRASRLDRCNNSLEKAMVLAWLKCGQRLRRALQFIIECFAAVQRIIQASVPPNELNKATKLNNRLGLKQNEPRPSGSLVWYIHLLGHITGTMSNPPDCKRALVETGESLIQRIVQPRLFVGGSCKVESCNGGLDIVLLTAACFLIGRLVPFSYPFCIPWALRPTRRFSSGFCSPRRPFQKKD
jgi:hypothetical protein